MAEMIRVLNPAGEVWGTEASPAPRLATLDGLRPGILENGKANARLVMETIVGGMRERWNLGDLTVGKKPVAGPPSDATVNLLKANSDFMLVGSSD